jgi:hypothetical protein
MSRSIQYLAIIPQRGGFVEVDRVTRRDICKRFMVGGKTPTATRAVALLTEAGGHLFSDTDEGRQRFIRKAEEMEKQVYHGRVRGLRHDARHLTGLLYRVVARRPGVANEYTGIWMTFRDAAAALDKLTRDGAGTYEIERP